MQVISSSALEDPADGFRDETPFVALVILEISYRTLFPITTPFNLNLAIFPPVNIDEKCLEKLHLAVVLYPLSRDKLFTPILVLGRKYRGSSFFQG